MTREDLDRGEYYALELNGRLSDETMREIFALAREALEAREAYRVECPDYRPPHEREGEWEVLAGERTLDWCRGYAAAYFDGEPYRIVRERDGEVVS